MKRILICLLILISIILLAPKSVVWADNSKTEEELLKEEVNKQVDNYDFDDLDEALKNDEFKITDENSFKDIVSKLINGQYNLDTANVFNSIFKEFAKNVKSIIPLLIMIFTVAILCNIITSFKPSENSKSISDLVHFVCMSVILVLIVMVVKNAYVLSTNCVEKISYQMSVLFPILLTIMTAMGSVVTVGIYNPIVSVLTHGVTLIFSKLIYPIFILSFVFIILNSLSSEIKLNKFINFLGSSFKWIVGFVFTLFAGLMTIQGISAGKYDTISLKATRFAMKSYIPIIGGYLSDGLDYVMLSSVLIKNAVGVAGVILLISTILIPIINLVVLKLSLQFVAGAVEPIGNSKISNLCEDLSKILIYPIVVILAISFMYFLVIGLIMCTITGV